jgi:hypothetical protein
MAGTTLKIKQSSISGKVPLEGSLVQGELAINTADQKLYSKDSNGDIFEIGHISAAGTVPSAIGHTGKFLTNNGTSSFWGDTDDLVSLLLSNGDSTDGDSAGGATVTFDLN